MARWTVSLIALSLTACDNAQVTQCQDELLATLKAPASYKRIKLDRSSIPDTIHKPPYDSVTITYDAVNSYNAPLRDEYTCFFKPGTTERMDNPFKADVEAETRQMEQAAADAALNEAANAVSNAGNAVEESQQAISPEGVEKLANAVRANSADALDACLDGANTTEQYEQCHADYGNTSEASD